MRRHRFPRRSGMSLLVSLFLCLLLVWNSGLSTKANGPTPPTFVKAWGSASPISDGQFVDPMGVAVDSSGNIFVADTGNDRIQKFSPNSAFLTAWGSHGSGDGQFLGCEGIAVDSGGNIYAADGGNNRIQKFTSDGLLLTKWGGP